LTYLCNAKNCEGFWFKSNNTHPIISGIQCKLKAPCYVQDRYDNATSTYYFVACNYTMIGCGDCYEKTDCALCYNGFHQYNSDIDTEKNICKSCSESIPGCLKCSSGSNCLVCDAKYRIMGGLCYNSDGTLVDGVSNSTNGIFVLLVIITIFIGIGVILFGFAVKKRLDHPHHQPLISN